MAIVLENLDEEIAPEELAEMSSFNHGYLQIKIGAHFLNEPNLTPSSEFTLDISALSKIPEIELAEKPNSLEPDIAVYRERPVDFYNDDLKGKQMPLLAVEILSPRQGVQALVDKFKIYFALGVQSCWLVYPYAQSIAVYRAPDDFEMFAKGDLVDDVVNIRLPLSEIFS
ncbi:Uma2 family endonuclease [Chloroflexi bacterium TSY]|nr:Uma2 family endonuclease [Chloroflexi bacterium TSY]